jgi:VanZ family protein
MADGARDSRGPARPLRDFGWQVLPALLWIVLVFVGGSIPSPGPEVDVGFPIDKVNHTVAFCVMQLLAFRALRYARPERGRSALAWLAALISLGVGVALELYQLGVPHRSAEVLDAVADAVGAGIGVLLVVLRR